MWRAALVRAAGARLFGNSRAHQRYAVSSLAGVSEEAVTKSSPAAPPAGATPSSASPLSLPSESDNEPVLRISDSCVRRLQQIGAARGSNVLLRVSVEGGGCSGFQYDFSLESAKEASSNDHIFERDGAKVVVDDVSMPFLDGAEVEWASELIRTSFRIAANPNSESSCSCGVSFSVS